MLVLRVLPIDEIRFSEEQKNDTKENQRYISKIDRIAHKRKENENTEKKENQQCDHDLYTFRFTPSCVCTTQRHGVRYEYDVIKWICTVCMYVCVCVWMYACMDCMDVYTEDID